jgi:hypothetical protein
MNERSAFHRYISCYRGKAIATIGCPWPKFAAAKMSFELVYLYIRSSVRHENQRGQALRILLKAE